MTISIKICLVIPFLTLVLLNSVVGFHINIKIMVPVFPNDKRQILCYGVNVHEATGKNFFLVEEGNIDIGQNNKMAMEELKTIIQGAELGKVEICAQLGNGAAVNVFNTVRNFTVDIISGRLQISYEDMVLAVNQSGVSAGTKDVVWSNPTRRTQEVTYVTVIYKLKFREERVPSTSITTVGKIPGVAESTNLPIMSIQLPTDGTFTNLLLQSVLLSPPMSWIMFLPRSSGEVLSDIELLFRISVVNAYIGLPNFVNFEYKFRTTDMIMKIVRLGKGKVKKTLTILVTATVSEYRHKLFFRKPSIGVFPAKGNSLPKDMKTVQECLAESNEWSVRKFVTYCTANQTREETAQAAQDSDFCEVEGSVVEEDEEKKPGDEFDLGKVLVMNYQIVGGAVYWR